jgi:DNA modification methylase
MILQGDIRQIAPTLPSESVHCIVTSPPYWGLRDYGVDGQIGLEPTPDEYVSSLVAVFRELRRVLRDDGTLWLNLGDSYSGSGEGGGGNRKGNEHGQHDSMIGKRGTSGLKPKDLVGIPWRVAFALQADGWWLRQDIIWAKPNPMPESVCDRCTKSHEYIFLLSKSARYWCDMEAIKEPNAPCYQLVPLSGPGIEGHRKHPAERNDESAIGTSPARLWNGQGRNRRDVWTVATAPYPEAHFATFPPDLIKPCILAGCPVGGTVLDPFLGSGTTAQVAIETGREWIGVELNEKYIPLAEKRARNAAGQIALGVM